MPQSPFRISLAFCLAALAIALPASAHQDDTLASNSTPPELHVVNPSDLTLQVEREGRIDSAERVKVRLIPREFKGPFEVVEVAQTSGRIKKGDVILRLNDEALEKELAVAQMSLDHAQQRLELARQEQRILNEANAFKREQSQKVRTNAEKELTIWEKFESPGMLKTAELNLKQREFGLADQKQELDQLESMYSGTQLATETKDIVLDRARRGVTMSEAWLLLSKNTELITREFRHATQDRNVRDSLRLAKQEEEHTAINTSAAEQRKKMEIETAERAVRDADERLAKLQQDKSLLTVTAPSDGIMTRIDFEPHDVINVRQTICEVLNPSKLVVKFSLTAEDLRVMPNGSSASQMPATFTLRLSEFPDVALTGEIEDIAELGSHADKATHFPLTVAIKTSDPMVRIGMRCKLFASRTIPDALTLPSNAVTWKDGEAWCTVQTPEGERTQRIVVGATAGERVEVVEGLAAGEQVVLKEAGSK